MAQRIFNHNFKDMTGQIFGRLTVVKFDKYFKKRTYWICKCVCGNTISIRGYSLREGNTISCGCYAKEVVSNNNEHKIKHGLSRSRFYRIWDGMLQRCTNPNNKDYPRYKNKLCDRWLTFINFVSDEYTNYLEHVKIHGEKNTTADRFPNQSGNYEASNFRWATNIEQARNKLNSAITQNYEQHLYWRYKLQSLLASALNRNQNSSALEIYLGCSLPELRKYIESQFTKGMTWDNNGSGIDYWQLDHILGCNNFDLSLEKDRLVCWNYKNLRPMWWEDHKNKSTFRKVI